MKKPHQFYRLYLTNHKNEQRHRAWLYETFEEPFNRNEFRRNFKRKLVLCYAVTPPLFVVAVVWHFFGPYWIKYNWAVDDFVARFNRIPMALWAFNTSMAILWVGIGIWHVHTLAWPLAIKVACDVLAFSIVILLSNIAYRCMERCAGNFCADMARWDND